MISVVFTNLVSKLDKARSQGLDDIDDARREAVAQQRKNGRLLLVIKARRIQECIRDPRVRAKLVALLMRRVCALPQASTPPPIARTCFARTRVPSSHG